MKKVLVSIVAALMAVPSFAQFSSGGFELDKESVYYGARIGLALGSLSGDSDPYDGVNSGLTLAGILGLRLSQQAPVFLESGLYYTQRGGKNGKYSADLNCLEVPVLIKYGIQATDKIAVLPFIGPYFAYGVGGDMEYDNNGHKEKDSTYDFLNRNDMGIKLGCGAEYNMLYLEIAYQFGLHNVADDDDDTIHANQFSINFGVNF
ncbi:MAG: PorT family protein [Prevotella sp.]|nr:PorT family protein [Prevotella sp.]